MALYRVGDEVIIRSDLRPSLDVYPMANGLGGYCVTPDMGEFRGKHAIIDFISDGNDYYNLSIDNGRWMWTDTMLEYVPPGNEEIYLASDEEFNEFLGLHAIK